MALTGKIGLDIRLRETKPADLATPEANILTAPAWFVLAGTGAGQADRLFSDERTLVSGNDEDLDLTGSLAGFYGTVAFGKLKGIAVEVTSTGAGVLTITQGADGVPIFQDAAGGVALGAGDIFVLTRKGAAGIAVADSPSEHLINFAASGGNVTYRVILVGTSA